MVLLKSKKLIKRILDPSPSTRITIAEVIENEWFKKGYKPPSFEQADISLVDVDSIFNEIGHSGELVVERREEGLVPVAPVTMNAFELISTSQGLNLNTLFEKQMISDKEKLELKNVIFHLLLKNKLIRKDKLSYGFVDYHDRTSAALAIMNLHGRQLYGQALKVNWAYTNNQREDTSASETVLIATLSKLEVSILRYYIAHAIPLNIKLSQLQALLEEKEAQLGRLKCNASSLPDASTGQTKSSSSFMHEDPIIYREIHEACMLLLTPQLAETVLDQAFVTGPSPVQSELTTFKLFHDSTTSSNLDMGDGRTGDSSQMWQDGPCIENGREVHIEEEFPEETFLGHTSPISRCRFSASGNNIASASIDGTVRIWTYDSSTLASRNATIYCGAEIMSLDWECKSDRMLLIGTADEGIKAWNVDAKRVVCDLSTTEAFPSVLDLKCSPVEPIFVSAAASKGNGSSYNDNLGFASLIVWNMKTRKAVILLPLGKDPPAITSLCFNHNGKILAASASDGMIHMFDMAAGLQITGWPAHDSAISSLLFGPDETSIFSLGSDGKASISWFSIQTFEWSLQNQGQVLWSRNCSSARGVASQLFLGQLQIHYLFQLNHIRYFQLLV
ncbi:hypothetical protein CMV_024221 [Castanea mollissima]|uniref:Uncharacterized protein n=1 Tax=Castanea mollissima TaxID=60419 RepID=A0A8J4QF89_9ROSI|nr:hypothetical protein CMV_024221 [Castanea mollissima]